MHCISQNSTEILVMMIPREKTVKERPVISMRIDPELHKETKKGRKLSTRVLGKITAVAMRKKALRGANKEHASYYRDKRSVPYLLCSPLLTFMSRDVS